MATIQLVKELEQKVATLDDEEVRVLERVADFLRTIKDRAKALRAIEDLLEKRVARTPPMSEAEVGQLVTDVMQ